MNFINEEKSLEFTEKFHHTFGHLKKRSSTEFKTKKSKKVYESKVFIEFSKSYLVNFPNKDILNYTISYEKTINISKQLNRQLILIEDDKTVLETIINKNLDLEESKM